MRDIKTRGSKNSFEVIMFEKICEITTSPTLNDQLFIPFYRFTRVGKTRYIPVWSASFLCFFFLIFMRPSFLCTVSFVKIDWKLWRLLKNFHSLILFFSQNRLTIAQLMFNLLRTKLFEKFFSYNARQSN